MAEQETSEGPSKASDSSLDPQKSLEELKESSVVTLSTTVDSVFHETEQEKSPAEHAETLPFETPTLPTIDAANSPTHNLPSGLPESVTTECSPAAPEEPMEQTSSLTEETVKLIPDNPIPVTLSPILEVPPPPTAPHKCADSREAEGLATSTAIPPESEIREGVSSGASGSVGEPADRIGAENTPVVASPSEVSPKAEVSTPAPDDIDIETERLSTRTGTPGGSANDLFLSTRESRENTVEPPPPTSDQPSPYGYAMVMQKMTGLGLSQEAMKVFKDLEGNQVLQGKKEEPLNVFTSHEESRATSQESAMDEFKAASDEQLPVQEKKEEPPKVCISQEESRNSSKKSAMDVSDEQLPEKKEEPPKAYTSQEESRNSSKKSAMDVSDEQLPEKKEEPPKAYTSQEESRTSSKKTAMNVGETTASVLSPFEIIGTVVGNSSEKSALETFVATEVPPLNIETLDEIDVVSTSTSVVEKGAEVLTLEIPNVMKETLLETDSAVPLQTEVKAAKPAEDVNKKVEDNSKETAEKTEKLTVFEDVPAKDKPILEISIHQRDSSKDPSKKQAKKIAEKTVKAPVKSPRALPQPANSGQTGSIAATGSASATSALSPRSEKSVKQMKSSRPSSARSARGLVDLSSSNSVLGILSSQLTGPQRVAAARAAASLGGAKTRKVLAPAPVVPDGNRSPRGKPSATSTVSNLPAAASSSVISNAPSTNPPPIQKRTSGSSSTHPTAPRRGASNSSDVHRAVGGLHGYQKLKSSNDLASLESTYSAILKSFIDTKKELQLKTKLAREMFTEIEKLRHLASTKFGKDLPLNEDMSGLAGGLAEAPAVRVREMLSEDGDRAIAAAESLLKSLISQRSELLSETSQHHASLLALCCEAAGDEGAKTPELFREKEFADKLTLRVTKVSATEHSHIMKVLQFLRTSLSDLEASKASCRDLRSQLELLNQENSNLTKSLADCTKDLEESRTEFGKVAAKKAVAEKEVKSLRMKLKETEAKVAAEEQKCKDLASQIRGLEDKVRLKDSTQEQRARETERKVKERIAKEHEELQRRLDEALKSQRLKESELEATCQQLESKLGSVTQLLEIKTKDKERIEEQLRATTEKLSIMTKQRSAETEELRREKAALVEGLHNMVSDEASTNGPQLKSELQALSNLLNERERMIEEKNSEIKRLQDCSKESGDSQVSKEEFLELQDTLSKLATHNEMLEKELSKMVQSAAKRDKVMEEQEKVLAIRDQLIAMLQGSNPSSATGVANPQDFAVQQKILDLQTTVERQAVRIKALESQLAETEKHQDGLQNLRTRYERRIAQLEHALSDHRGTTRSETLTKIRTFLHGNLSE